MNTIHQNIINLIKSGLTGEKVVLSSDIDWNATMFLCQTHELIPIIYYGLQNSVDIPPQKLYDQLENLLVKYIVNDMSLEKVYNEVSAAFNESGIDYMPMKGINVKKLYPKSEMRVMSDVDILLREKHHKKACVVLQARGYNFELESTHEFVFTKNKQAIELHKSLIPEYNTDFYKYYGEGWEKAIPSEKFMYRMSDEDEFIFLFSHLAKHYRDAGINILHMIDVWVYMQNCNLDMEYVKTELEKLKLYDFFKNIYATLENWFADGEATEMTEFLTEKMFSFGCWGNPLNRSLSKSVKETDNGKEQKIKSTKVKNFLFPPYNVMKISYPMVKNRKYLLPVAWVVRFFKLPFKQKSAKAFGNEMKVSTKENIERYKNELKYVGLEYRLNENEE